MFNPETSYWEAMPPQWERRYVPVWNLQNLQLRITTLTQIAPFLNQIQKSVDQPRTLKGSRWESLLHPPWPKPPPLLLPLSGPRCPSLLPQPPTSLWEPWECLYWRQPAETAGVFIVKSLSWGNAGPGWPPQHVQTNSDSGERSRADCDHITMERRSLMFSSRYFAPRQDFTSTAVYMHVVSGRRNHRPYMKPRHVRESLKNIISCGWIW